MSLIYNIEENNRRGILKSQFIYTLNINITLYINYLKFINKLKLNYIRLYFKFQVNLLIRYYVIN